MWDRVKNWLGLTRNSAFVTDEFDRENMRTSLYMCCVIIVLEIWMIVSAIYGNLSGLRVRSVAWMFSHIGMYLLLIAIAVAMFAHSVLSLKRNKNHHIQSVVLFAVFTIVCILFGTYISYYDYIKGEQLFTFISLTVFARHHDPHLRRLLPAHVLPDGAGRRRQLSDAGQFLRHVDLYPHVRHRQLFRPDLPCPQSGVSFHRE